MRYLAIDHGLKRTGLAVCDAGETICSPLVVLDEPKVVIERIIKVIMDESIEAVVLGLPLNMDGTQGPQAELVKQFGKKLQSRIDVPIHFHDERLSSFAAEQEIAGLEITRGKKKKHLDAIAAAHLLEAFLESKQA
jgi:putative Holliday junction resolvase